MKRIQIIIIMLCMIAVGARSQTAINGTPGTLSGPGGYIPNIRAAELSPLNIQMKGTPQIVQQFFARDIEDKDEPLEENEERALTQYYMMKDNAMRNNAVVKPIDENANISMPAPPAESQKVTSQSPGYSGLGNQYNGLDPSDAQIAVGPNHIVVLANSDARILNKKTGAIISQVTLPAFFNWSGFVFDPRVMYDPYGQRFVALALNTNLTSCSPGNVNSSFRVLISNNNDPTQGWYWYDFDVDGANTSWMDFAMLGFNKDWICIAGNILCGTAPGIYVLNKTQAYAAATANFYTWSALWLAAPAFTYDNAIDRLYLCKPGNPNLGGTGYLDTWYINSAAQMITGPSFGTSPWQAFATNASVCPPQLGGGTFTSVNIFGASMLSNCVYRGGNLWCTHPVFLPATGNTNRTSTQWWAVNPASNTITHVGRIDDGSATEHTYYPSISVNFYSDAVVTYSQFGASHYSGASYNYRNFSDAVSQLPNGVYYAGGANNDGDGRGGDYSQACVDPLDDNAFWVCNQLPNGVWETRFAALPGYYGCYTDATFGNVNWNGLTKNEASNSITSAEMITASSMVDYDAGSFITLSPGFVANQGCTFKAYINGCGGSLSRGSRDKSLTIADQTRTAVNSLEPSFSLFPNPSNGEFVVNLNLVTDNNVTITIYDATMKEVEVVNNNSLLPKGSYNRSIDLSHLDAGIYFCRVNIGSDAMVRKVQIVK